jgi:hypothetical protein
LKRATDYQMKEAFVERDGARRLDTLMALIATCIRKGWRI